MVQWIRRGAESIDQLPFYGYREEECGSSYISRKGNRSFD
jgi:hypothetical protein